jgi:hypothetical protein
LRLAIDATYLSKGDRGFRFPCFFNLCPSFASSICKGYIHHEDEIVFKKKRVITLKKEEFLEQIEGIMLPEMFDQHLLDHAAEMFGRWGKSTHLNEKEHLFESFGLASKPDDNNDIKMQKIALRFVCTRMMEANLNRKDAADLIRNFNKFKDPGYAWLE